MRPTPSSFRRSRLSSKSQHSLSSTVSPRRRAELLRITCSSSDLGITRLRFDSVNGACWKIASTIGFTLESVPAPLSATNSLTMPVTSSSSTTSRLPAKKPAMTEARSTSHPKSTDRPRARSLKLMTSSLRPEKDEKMRFTINESLGSLKISANSIIATSGRVENVLNVSSSNWKSCSNARDPALLLRPRSTREKLGANRLEKLGAKRLPVAKRFPESRRPLWPGTRAAGPADGVAN
mmetsp:Transcript_9127/g.21619  ORF Transcript_9127/g.21619 Transcript_9127/m.21619 type:complete len:237 (+) Transcript_9127:1220-1930(+)